MTDRRAIVRGGRSDVRDQRHEYVRPTVRPYIPLGNGARKRAILPTL